MAHYLSSTKSGPFHFISEVAKEVAHQVTGIKFDDNKKESKNPMVEANIAYAEAVSSAFRQQEEYERERADEYNIEDYEDFDVFIEQDLSNDDQWTLDF